MIFHWSCFFDDFFITGNSAESKHLDLMQKGFFALLGWETSAEKGGDFQAVAKALGVQFSFADSSSGLLSVCNTEGRIKEVCGQVQTLLDEGKATAAELATLKGAPLVCGQPHFWEEVQTGHEGPFSCVCQNRFDPLRQRLGFGPHLP